MSSIIEALFDGPGGDKLRAATAAEGLNEVVEALNHAEAALRALAALYPNNEALVEAAEAAVDHTNKAKIQNLTVIEQVGVSGLTDPEAVARVREQADAQRDVFREAGYLIP